MYWLLYAACSWVFSWCGWLIRCPFVIRVPSIDYQFPFLFLVPVVDLFDQLLVLVLCYLVLPQTMGIKKLPLLIDRLFGVLLATVMSKIKFPLPEKKAAEDAPGPYTLIKAAGVMPTLHTAKGSVTRELRVGDVINVVEVVRLEEEKRVRARVEDPPGWISLLNMESGTRWAVPGKQVPQLDASMMTQTSSVFANAAAVGCNPSALFQGVNAQQNSPGAQEVSADDAWEAMALLESQLARADDFSEDMASRQAAGMLKAMLTTLVQSPNPAALSMAQMMMPDIGRIWANESTRIYLQELLTASAGNATSGAAPGGSSTSSDVVTNTSSAAPSSSADASSGSGSATGTASGSSGGSASGSAGGSASGGAGGSASGSAGGSASENAGSTAGGSSSNSG